MFIVMGATGHVGGAVADALLAEGEAVTVVTRSAGKGAAWRARGVDVTIADAEDADSLGRAFACGRRAFLLNPPGDPTGDVDATERRTIANILEALRRSRLEKVVAASTYGTRPGERIGDLSTLWGLEEGLRAQPIPAAINRGAYYMTNWLALSRTVKCDGVLPSMFPADRAMPMVAPADLGRAAAARLLSSTDDVGVRHVEGPRRYTPQDVANAFAAALGRPVTVEVTPRERWAETYRTLGFSPAAVDSFVRMTAVSLDEPFAEPEGRGRVELSDFIADALSASNAD